jgi:pimeloyl-ACP methyl ester carboxylesterase
MSEPIVIVHGWSDSSASFQNLGNFLAEQVGTDVTQIDLGDWLSLNDEVTYLDLRAAMDAAWNANPLLADAPVVNVVTHSTGALVVREWMTWRYLGNRAACPIRRLVMLAPANFGSPQAHLGTSFFGRLYKGWSTGGQVGAKLLSGLELGSDYTWKLAERDYFAADPWYGSDRIMGTVLVGCDGYGGLRGIASEFGSDGTVRVSTANLNAAKLSIRFDDNGNPVGDLFDGIEMPPVANQLAFGVLAGLNHGSITSPPYPGGYGDHLVRALTLAPEDYADFKTSLADVTAATYAQVGSSPYYHHYQNTVVHSFDDFEQPVAHYLVQFHGPGAEGDQDGGSFDPDQASVAFQQEIIHDEHNFAADSSYRCFYADVDILESKDFSAGLFLRVDPQPECDCATPDAGGPPVGYARTSPIAIGDATRGLLFRGNRTLLVSVEFTRSWQQARVFKFRGLTQQAPDAPLS